jgi:hypothetical protein
MCQADTKAGTPLTTAPLWQKKVTTMSSRGTFTLLMTSTVTAFKFALGSWDLSYGDTGADGTLEADGGDITVPEPGVYFMYVDLDALTYSLEKVQFGIIGTATAGRWDNDTDMVYNAESGAWTITAPLIGGQCLKFRANDGWDLNYGDLDDDGLLELNGDNISVANSAVYKIKLFLDRPDYTFSVEIPASDNRAMFYTEGQSLVGQPVSFVAQNLIFCP